MSFTQTNVASPRTRRKIALLARVAHPDDALALVLGRSAANRLRAADRDDLDAAQVQAETRGHSL